MHDPGQVSRLFAGGDWKGVRLFDASCGKGASSEEFRRLGFEVYCSTFKGAPAVSREISCVSGVDLNGRLPFRDDSFDYAVLQEVIEHIENPAHVIREFNRVLKPGGFWVLTAPNALCLRSRLHFLLSGFLKGRRKPANYNVPPGNYSNLFIPALPALHYLLWVYGFRVARTGRSERKLSSRLLYALMFPFVFLWTWYYTRAPKRYDSPLQREASKDLRALLLSKHFLVDENFVLLLEKRHGLEGLYAPPGG